jgi:hypothetical protein
MKTLNEALTDISLEEIDNMSMSARAERLRNRYRVVSEESHAMDTNIDIVVEAGICNIHGEYSQNVRRFNHKHINYKTAEGRNWQYPKKDELCPKCRAENARNRFKKLKEESQQDFFNKLPLEQRLELREQKAVDKEKENRRRTHGYDYSYNIAGDK